MKELSRYLNGWVAHFRLCTEEATKALRAVDAHIRRRLRAMIAQGGQSAGLGLIIDFWDNFGCW